MFHNVTINGENFVQIDTKSGETKKVKKYYMNKTTGELLTYSEAKKECSANNDFDDPTNIFSQAEQVEIFKDNYRLIELKD